MLDVLEWNTRIILLVSFSFSYNCNLRDNLRITVQYTFYEGFCTNIEMHMHKYRIVSICVPQYDRKLAYGAAGAGVIFDYSEKTQRHFLVRIFSLHLSWHANTYTAPTF